MLEEVSQRRGDGGGALLPVAAISILLFILSSAAASDAFYMPSQLYHVKHTSSLSSTTTTALMSFMADSSDYKTDKSDYGDGGDESDVESATPIRGEVDMADVSVTEEIPVPTSRNSVDRFVALVFDRILCTKKYDDNDKWEMHRNRVALTEDHVMWARKQNLYNETFNTDSMADIRFSHQL